MLDSIGLKISSTPIAASSESERSSGNSKIKIRKVENSKESEAIRSNAASDQSNIPQLTDDVFPLIAKNLPFPEQRDNALFRYFPKTYRVFCNNAATIKENPEKFPYLLWMLSKLSKGYQNNAFDVMEKFVMRNIKDDKEFMVFFMAISDKKTTAEKLIEKLQLQMINSIEYLPASCRNRALNGMISSDVCTPVLLQALVNTLHENIYQSRYDPLSAFARKIENFKDEGFDVSNIVITFKNYIDTLNPEVKDKPYRPEMVSPFYRLDQTSDSIPMP